MKKIAVVTSTRAEYGILRPLLYRLMMEPEYDVQLIVTGTHLEEAYGDTQGEIVADKIPIYARIPILSSGNDPCAVSHTMANALRSFADFFQKEHPHLLFVVGDRTEMLGVCAAAMNEQIPIAHLHGGEVTEGAVDDCVRHAITKMSYLHFAAAEEYRRRIIQMGEAPERVFNVGALGVENILKVSLLSSKEVHAQLELPEKYCVVTFHPVTLEYENAKGQVTELICAMRRKREYFYLITKANADAGGEMVNRMFEAFAAEEKNVRLVASLGMVRYLSAVKYSSFVLGNSSSGIIEAPALGTPTINVGDRQKGRLMADTVISCEPQAESIVKAIDQAEHMEHRVSRLYGDGRTSSKIMRIVKDFFSGKEISLKKGFYDLQV